jgi:hypothetical protein
VNRYDRELIKRGGSSVLRAWKIARLVSRRFQRIMEAQPWILYISMGTEFPMWVTSALVCCQNPSHDEIIYKEIRYELKGDCELEKKEAKARWSNKSLGMERYEQLKNLELFIFGDGQGNLPRPDIVYMKYTDEINSGRRGWDYLFTLRGLPSNIEHLGLDCYMRFSVEHLSQYSKLKSLDLDSTGDYYIKSAKKMLNIIPYVERIDPPWALDRRMSGIITVSIGYCNDPIINRIDMEQLRILLKNPEKLRILCLHRPDTDCKRVGFYYDKKWKWLTYSKRPTNLALEEFIPDL